jgi:hypothetical protein
MYLAGIEIVQIGRIGRGGRGVSFRIGKSGGLILVERVSREGREDFEHGVVWGKRVEECCRHLHPTQKAF